MATRCCSRSRCLPREQAEAAGEKSRDGRGKIRADGRTRYLLMRRRKEGNRTVQSANPDLGCARIEIESAFFVDFGRRIGGGKDLNADLWGACKEERLLGNLGPIGSEPGNIDSLDTVGIADWALSMNEPFGKQLAQKT